MAAVGAVIDLHNNIVIKKDTFDDEAAAVIVVAMSIAYADATTSTRGITILTIASTSAITTIPIFMLPSLSPTIASTTTYTIHTHS